MPTSNKSTIPTWFVKIKPQEAVLVLITMLWGGTFLAVHQAMLVSGPFFFVGLRFATATLALVLFSWRSLPGITWYEIKAGVFIGTSIMLGYGLQTMGLQTITSSQSAFITAMYVPIVPLLQWLVLGRMPGIMSWIGILLAFIGLILLAGPNSASMAFSGGEFLTLISALAIAVEVILIGAFAGKVNVRRVTIVQLATASLLSFLMMAPTGESVPAFSSYLLYSALGLGIASALIQLTMNWAQRSVSPTRATVIYAGEPVWAGIVGRIAGERLPAIALVGAALIVLGVIVSELRIRRRAKPQVASE
ncbi:DMT family transporter [Serratia sp. L9]|uniref:DMT family transporter n=1 Tax=Serratia sp. L9 TaxID=3423946 RepID=UPI003D668D4C